MPTSSMAAAVDTDQRQARGLFFFLAMSRLLLSAAAAAAAVAVRLRRKARVAAQWAQTTWNRANHSKVASVMSLSDLAFLLCVLALWTALYAVCMWDDPAEFASEVASTPLAVMDSMGGFVLALPALLFPVKPFVASSATPTPSASVATPDHETLVRQILASPDLEAKVKELSTRYTAPIREELLSYSHKKAQEMEALLQQGEKDREEELRTELRRKLEELKAHTQEKIEQSEEQVTKLAAEEYKATVGPLQREVQEIKAENRKLIDRLAKATEDKQKATRAQQELARLEGKLNEINTLRGDFEAKMAGCCKKASTNLDEALLKSEVEAAVDRWTLNVMGGDDASSSATAAKFKEHLRSEYVSRAEMETLVERLTRSLSAEVRSEVLAWAQSHAEVSSASAVDEIMRNSTLLSMFREKIAADLTALSALATASSSSSSSSVSMSNDHEILSAIHDALRVYDADKTGKFDFALESAGGTIASIRCTETYDVSNAVYSVFGIPFWWERNSPRAILQPGANPGQCWAFKGSRGEVVIKLSNPIHPEVRRLYKSSL